MSTTTFAVDDMTCGHCVSTIIQALASLDEQATVSVDLGNHRVQVTSTRADPAQLQQAIQEAGYTPVLVQPGAAATAQPKRSGCGCGCG